MPGMSGLEFFSKLRSISPDTVKVLISSQVNLPTAMAAINGSELSALNAAAINPAGISSEIDFGSCGPFSMVAKTTS